jgi:hypothetical protein
MITDALLRVSNAQAVTTTAVSTDTVDLGVARDIGAGENLFMNFTVGTAFAGGTSTEFQVIGSASADLSSPTVLGSSGALATAGLTAGKRTAVRVNPLIGSNGLRYFGARYVVVGTNTAGTVTADVVHGVQDQKSYASGFTVA